MMKYDPLDSKIYRDVCQRKFYKKLLPKYTIKSFRDALKKAISLKIPLEDVINTIKINI